MALPSRIYQALARYIDSVQQLRFIIQLQLRIRLELIGILFWVVNTFQAVNNRARIQWLF